MNMEEKYIMDMQNNYLILECNEDSSKAYSSKMILNNNIPGLLKTEIRSIDDKDFFYYNITSKDTLFNIYENRLFDYESLKDIISAIIKIIEDSSEYLLEEKDFILKPESVYIDKTNKKITLCYLPSYNMPLLKQFSKVIEYFMNKVDYKDEQAVILVYALYKITKENNVTFKQLKDELNKNIQNRKPASSNLDNNDNSINKRNIKSLKDANKTISSGEFASELSDEKEIMVYSKKSYILALISIISTVLIFIVVIKVGLLHNSFGTQIDIVKLLCFIIVIACLEGLAISKIFNMDNKVSKIIPNTRTLAMVYTDKKTHYKDLKQDNQYRDNVQSDATKDYELEHFQANSIEHVYQVDDEEANGYNTQILWREEKDKEEYKTEILADLDQDQTSYFLESSSLINNSIHINVSPYIIGKNSNGVNCTIDDPSVSRFHARFLIDNEGISVTDLNSTNGTYINGSRIDVHVPWKLNNNDEICFSKCRFIIKIQ